MEKPKIIFQRMKHSIKDEYELAEKYYAALSVVNNLGLTKRELQLIAFTAINGNISPIRMKEEFCKKYGTTQATINNLICRLKKMKVFIKTKDRVKVNPKIILDFSSHLRLEINLVHGEAR